MSGKTADDDQIGNDVYQQMLVLISAPECRKKFLQNPLGHETAKAFSFGSN